MALYAAASRLCIRHLHASTLSRAAYNTDVTSWCCPAICLPVYAAVPNATLARPGGGFFDLYRDPLLTAPEAEAVCVRAGGHLASDTDDAIHAALRPLSQPPHNLDSFWLGLWSAGGMASITANYKWLSRAPTSPDMQALLLVSNVLWANPNVVAYAAWTWGWIVDQPGAAYWWACFPEALMPYVCERLQAEPLSLAMSMSDGA